jgi:hypothetical protein
MSDISVCILTVIIQHSTSNAGHRAGVDQVMIYWWDISPNSDFTGFIAVKKGTIVGCIFKSIR